MRVERQESVLVFLDQAGPALGNFGDVHACWGQSVLLRFAPETEVLTVQRLLVGVGDECNPPHCFG